MKFSEGFNPRPKMSLPLPRPVGVYSDDEILTAGIELDDNIPEHIKKLKSQLPDGCKVIETQVEKSKLSYRADAAVYRFELKQLLAEKPDIENKVIERKNKKSETKEIDLNEYIKNIEIDGNTVMVNIAITDKGSLRVDEILNILNVTRSALAEPVGRVFVEWKKK